MNRLSYTMPALPSKPAAIRIDLDDNGRITGLN